ncbi:hypothetical protein A2U01_0017688, partial [Trifolium medium]|nr:hypothetical protein [Trifolium medium]
EYGLEENETALSSFPSVISGLYEVVAIGVRCGTSRRCGASDVNIGSRWPVAALSFSDLFLHFVSFINSLSGFTLVFGVPLSLFGLSALSLSKSALKLPDQGCPIYLPPRSSLGVGGIHGRSDHSALAVASWRRGSVAYGLCFHSV